MTVPLLPLREMHRRHVGLTHAVAEYYLEAARVCLDRHHTSPQEFALHDDQLEARVCVEWDHADDRTRAAWANENDCTRDGAYACALAATELARGMYAVRRAETRTGADYYVAPSQYGVEDLEDCFRLEVSGTNQDDSRVKARLREKIKEARSGNSNLPALAAVVGFQARVIMIRTVEEEE